MHRLVPGRGLRAHAASAPDRRSLALDRIGVEVGALPYPWRQILEAQLGLEGAIADLTTLGERLALPVEHVEQMLEEALVDLGFALIGPRPSDVGIVGVIAATDSGVNESWEEAA
jgi:hypothetical protein